MLLKKLLKSLGAKPRRSWPLPPHTVPASNAVRSLFSSVFWSTTKPEAVLAAAKEIVDTCDGGSYFGDNFLTWGRNMSMLDDKAFVEAWSSNAETPSDQAILWRRYVLACAAYHCVQLEGDFVECGAYTGVGIKTVVDYLGGVDFPKRFWGYDIFEHDESMENHDMPAHGSGLHARVQEKFANYPQVKIVKGLIPASFDGNIPDRIAYLHIDLNQATAEIAALEVLFERMVPGAILILDDYEWACYREQKLAEDLWFEKRQYRVMPLPTGQGLLIKR